MPQHVCEAPENDTLATSKPQVRLRTCLQNNIQKLKVYIDDTVKYACLTQSCEPRDVKDALQDENW
jgi:hypothetical protein